MEQRLYSSFSSTIPYSAYHILSEYFNRQWMKKLQYIKLIGLWKIVNSCNVYPPTTIVRPLHNIYMYTSAYTLIYCKYFRTVPT